MLNMTSWVIHLGTPGPQGCMFVVVTLSLCCCKEVWRQQATENFKKGVILRRTHSLFFA